VHSNEKHEKLQQHSDEKHEKLQEHSDEKHEKLQEHSDEKHEKMQQHRVCNGGSCGQELTPGGEGEASRRARWKQKPAKAAPSGGINTPSSGSNTPSTGNEGKMGCGYHPSQATTIPNATETKRKKT
jgi:hypothetical protein